MRLNRVHVIPGRGCVCGVVGPDCVSSTSGTPFFALLLGEVVWNGLPE